MTTTTKSIPPACEPYSRRKSCRTVPNGKGRHRQPRHVRRGRTAWRLDEIPEQYGGFGRKDFRYNIILAEEAAHGYMLEYPIARAFIDSRVSRIYAGSNEIMKEIIGRPLDLS
jgi:hypothetical protein